MFGIAIGSFLNVCIYPPTDLRIIITVGYIVEPSFLVIDIPTIPQGIQLRQSTHHGNDVAPCIVSILGYRGSGGGFHRHYVALQVGDVIVDGAIVSHGQRRAVGIIAEIQNVVPNGHPHQLVAGIDVAVGLVVAYPSGAQIAGVVLHLPVPRIQLHRGDPGAAHVAMRIGDEAAVLRAFALRRHLHPQGGGSLSGQIRERGTATDSSGLHLPLPLLPKPVFRIWANIAVAAAPAYIIQMRRSLL